MDLAEDCTFQFSWATSAACPARKAASDTCQVTDPSTGTVFDLTPLADQGNVNVDAFPYTYVLSVCNSVQGTTGALGECEHKHAGICQTWQTDPALEKSLGLAGTHKLTYADKTLSLKYTLGDTCHEGKDIQDERASIIDFTCPGPGEAEKPRFMGESEDCLYSFVWPTEQACVHKRAVQCVIDHPDGYQIDLSPLTRRWGDGWEVKNQEKDHQFSYMMNVCESIGKPPVGNPFHNCSDRAGICQVTAEHTLNLGGVSPPAFEGSDLVMRYDSGDADLCEGEKHRSSVIKFICGDSLVPGEYYGEPVFVGEKTGCEYDFEWTTPAACKAERVIGDDCKLTTPSGQNFDLNPLGARSWQVADAATGHTYDVNVCGALESNCADGTGACQVASNQQTFSMGKASKKVQLVKEHVNVVYEGGTNPPPRPLHSAFCRDDRMLGYGYGGATYLPPSLRCIWAGA